MTRRDLFKLLVIGPLVAARKPPIVVHDRQLGISIRFIKSWDASMCNLFNPPADLARQYREAMLRNVAPW